MSGKAIRVSVGLATIIGSSACGDGSTEVSAPVISSFSVVIVDPSSPTCPPRSGLLGVLVSYSLDYMDGGGGIAVDGPFVELTTVFDSGEVFVQVIEPDDIQVIGDGSSGTLTFARCHWFTAGRTSIDNTVVVADADGDRSNSLMLSFDDPN